MISHECDRGVLVITVHRDPGVKGRAELATEICTLIGARRPASVVIVLDEPATTGPAVSAVLRANAACRRLDILMSVATHSAPARRMLEANADTGGTRLVVHARIDTAVSAALSTAL